MNLPVAKQKTRSSHFGEKKLILSRHLILFFNIVSGKQTNNVTSSRIPKRRNSRRRREKYENRETEGVTHSQRQVARKIDGWLETKGVKDAKADRLVSATVFRRFASEEKGGRFGGEADGEWETEVEAEDRNTEN
ncbi:hypothetical protein RUM43_014711 [Polyplax serrata]|uniref:Uncharacterized protein n=1 Tax=Polyplax serrata TaxID=468196 RepID=A0AAN8RZC5_POLSC